MDIKLINGCDFGSEFKITRENIYALLTSNKPFIDELLLRYSSTFRYYKNHDNEALRAYKCMSERLYMILTISFIIDAALDKEHKNHYTVMDFITNSVVDIDSIISDTFLKVHPKTHIFGDDNVFAQFDYLIHKYEAFPMYDNDNKLTWFKDIIIHPTSSDSIKEASNRLYAFKLHDFDLDNILKTLDNLHYTI